MTVVLRCCLVSAVFSWQLRVVIRRLRLAISDCCVLGRVVSDTRVVSCKS